QTRPQPDPELRKLALAYVEGFNAADADRISVQSLVEGEEKESEIDGQRIHRVAGGYDRVAHLIANPLAPVQLRSVVRAVRWKRHRITVEIESPQSEHRRSLTARQLICTLPLGVLQADPDRQDSSGAVRFDPPISE